ncbi:hypothetical protein Droror1_Dr00015103 [Drosera rotundifolia]
MKAPTLVELTINEEELRRLRKEGMALKDKVNVAKAGVRREVVEKIHKQWRFEELFRLKFHEALTHDMKTAHEIFERRTGGLVVYRSGSVMEVYRGRNYKGPPSRLRHGDGDSNVPFVTDGSATENTATNNRDSSGSDVDNSSLTMSHNEYHHIMTQEEVEYNDMLDGLGPRWVQNTNNELMVEELKRLTGGVLLMRNNELLAPMDNLVVSTEKLRQRLQEEGVPESAIEDSELIMRSEFAALQKQLLLLK